MECGVAWFKIDVEGTVKYQPLLSVPSDSDREAHPGALPKGARAVFALEDWAQRYRDDNTCEYDHGTMRPTAGVGAIRAGLPYTPAKSPATASLYLDVRLSPGKTSEFVRKDIGQVLANADLDATIECYLFRQGHVADETAVKSLIESIDAAHRVVRGGSPPEPRHEVTSMWRDSNIFNEAGTPAVNIGPPRSFETYGDTAEHCKLHMDDLVETAQLYAQTALELCSDTMES